MDLSLLQELNNLNATTMDSYAWREIVHEAGEQFLVAPHSDPFYHEYPLDYVFSSKEEAVEWLNRYIEDYGYYDDIETVREEASKWILVRLHTRLVSTGKDCLWEIESNED